MELSTTVNFFILPHDQGMDVYYEELRNYRRLGFSVLDCIFCNADSPGSPLLRGDWKQWGEAIADYSKKLGVHYAQCHMPYYNFTPSGQGIDVEKEKLVRRSIEVAAVLGAKWIVGHPATDFNACDMPSISREENLRYFAPYVALGEKRGIGIAIENMADFPRQGYPRSYCATVSELCDLADALGSPCAGICWDFGHANLMYRDQAPCLKSIGPRLKAVHVHDNFGKEDSHLPVFFGNIHWEPLMRTLKEIRYEGVFSFETKRIPIRLPQYMRNAQWSYVKTTGDYLLSQVDSLEEAK